MLINTPYLLIFTAITLGMRHGLDLDHIAAIDAITRTIKDKKHIAKWTGCLFSLGHGIIVMGVSWLIGCGLFSVKIPSWFETFGKWVSIFFLLIFGAANLQSLFTRSPNNYLGIKSFIANKVISENVSIYHITLIGALFAISFDTLSQVAVFSLSASVIAGSFFSLLIGFFFTLGMIVSDGLNGILVSGLIQRADSKSVVFSKILGIFISVLSLILAAITIFDFFI